ncbi:proline dehydrogenase family protein [uncultured Cohaesibacter sp.]|uniref:proline dehydrogenase family protein n=1 Tax=uncultured Cohaesibacter sp. TaxID=1002546 RepID=UPI00292FEDF7
MIALARSAPLQSYMQNSKNTKRLARHFVGESNAVAALDMAERLRQKGIRTSFHHLGNDARNSTLIERNVAVLDCLISLLKSARVDGHVSVSPSHMGCGINWDTGAGTFWPLAFGLQHATTGRDGQHCLMINMEDHSTVGQTIELYHRLNQDGYPVAITLQANLKRTTNDLDRIIGTGGKVRLVKGAFPAAAKVSHVNQRAIRENYLQLVDLMLSHRARESGFYPIFATHDTGTQAHILQQADRNGWHAGSYEFELLYGIRPDLAEQLMGKGALVRLYVPFGEDWWPYAIRRIGEHPGNARLLLGSVC